MEYILFPDEDPDLEQPENRLRFYASEGAFLAMYLSGRHGPNEDIEDHVELERWAPIVTKHGHSFDLGHVCLRMLVQVRVPSISVAEPMPD